MNAFRKRPRRNSAHLRGIRAVSLFVILPALIAQSVRLPEDQGKAAFQKVCSQCHGLDVALAHPRTRDQWRSTVEDMVARGARGTNSEIDEVVNYLAGHFSRQGSETPASSTGASGHNVNRQVERAPWKPVRIPEAQQWNSFGHDLGGTRYSPLKQITPRNVAKLERAWTFHVGKPGSECTPVVINGIMYFTSPDAVYAVEPETGKLIWKFAANAVARRGLAYWPGQGSAHPRVYAGVENGKLVALDAATGKPAPGFADEGFLNLKTGVLGDLSDAKVYLQSPPTVYKNILITGSNNNEPSPSKGAYGDVRGWDAASGKLLWTFHTVPRKGEPGNETWADDGWRNRSGTNMWGFATVDVERGLVFLPIGAPTTDFYGADRHGDNLYGNSLVALDAETGKLKWFRQLVHHDLWDYDVAAAPALIEVSHDGKKIPAVAQITKMGMLFIFNRVTGQPIYDIKEQPVPHSHIPGEASSSTQPFTTKPLQLARNQFSPKDLYSLTPEHAAFCKELLEKNRMFTEGPFTPMSLETQGNALTFPSTLGGGNWSGLSYDPALGYVFTNIMNLGQWGHMEQAPDAKTGQMTWVRKSAFGPYARFWDPDTHIPCTNPPFGELVAVNVNTGDVAWRVPLGTIPELEVKGIHNTGSVNLGGSITTASGLVFIAATNDGRFRAFDARSGKQLWAEKLDAPAYAVPITYRGRDGKQYVAITAGGGGYFASLTADTVIAFALQ
jgi:quinoprotein glucose dehydrogenase